MVSALRVVALFFGVMHCCANTLLKDDCVDGDMMLQLNSVNTQVLGVKVQQSGGGDQVHQSLRSHAGASTAKGPI